MIKTNAAIAYYIQAWQAFIATISILEKTDWHPSIAPLRGDPMEMARLAWEDLHEALLQYRDWQKQSKAFDQACEIYWQEDGTQLLDFGGDGLRVLMVPSMINGHDILHLPEPASLAGYLRSNGLHPFILNWGSDFESSQSLDLKEFQRRLEAASNAIGRSVLFGYCLGGTLSHLTELPNIQRQVLIGTPWRFHHDQGRVGQFALALKRVSQTRLEAHFDNLVQSYGLVPSLYVDYLFAALNPLQFVDKFRLRGARADQAQFDAIEDWLNTGRDLSAPLARELIFDWFRDDALYHSGFQSTRPTLAIYGKRDHIAPPKACLPIADTGDSVECLAHDAGHVGLLVGNQSRSRIWPQIVNYLQNEIG